MAMFLHAIIGVLVILGMIAVGYVLAKRNWFDEASTKLIAKIVTQLALPCYMLSTIMTDFSTKELKALLPDLKFPVLSMSVLFVVSILVAHILHIRRNRQGLFESMFFISNTVFVGLALTSLCSAKKVCPMCWFTTWPIRPSFGPLAFTSSAAMAVNEDTLIGGKLSSKFFHHHYSDSHSPSFSYCYT